MYFAPFERMVAAGAHSHRSFVKKLRAKLGDDAAKPAWILNDRGVGYRMPKPGETRVPAGSLPARRASSTRTISTPASATSAEPGSVATA